MFNAVIGCCTDTGAMKHVDDMTLVSNVSDFEVNSDQKTVLWGPASDIANEKYDLSMIRGTPQCPALEPAAVEDVINNFSARDSDVFICTYVKSGTTWTQQIVHLLLNDGEQGPKSYAESIPWLEAATSPILSQWEATGHTIASIEATDGPRYFKTHASFQDLPKGSANPKVIYVARNPKDVVVSLYHHAKNKPVFGFTGGFDKMLHFFMEGKCENGSWFKHVLDWHGESKKNANVLYMHYEDMVESPAEHVERIAKFLNIDASPELIAKVVEKSSLKSMQKAGVNEEMKKAGITAHIRKGGAGGWVDWFNVRQNAAFDAVYKELMTGSELQFNFGAGLVM
uniref:Sulfotransferase domain-containing protein n=1 Tax=Fibrocapsa japonica TaxID=94617 RepID=A0A7S2V4V9_9STRA|mmetsp:Transcript_7364/g.11086  ORF Transcript_7364/g.11086 Transcript_7364/m.11086 type:complete len:341 (+) Transcript_7364:90-1112(+)|eukprot:CAMPEP_0113934214 /NCGR_PEP_ID=MMETSP1339-20121228/1551_1 /TAXON_ID=94617 /ORGANISM="Fibrocapsa japonica" /LENGTH=340 /DNA_ID=CAMNT_0000935917 /DNA_START=85 /DNA_END=1107 /DNA_ORIENTATION=+ /assembly_acc=CAM_ASM_000762